MSNYIIYFIFSSEKKNSILDILKMSNFQKSFKPSDIEYFVTIETMKIMILQIFVTIKNFWTFLKNWKKTPGHF